MIITRLSSRFGVFVSKPFSGIIATAVPRHRLPQTSLSYECSVNPMFIH